MNKYLLLLFSSISNACITYIILSILMFLSISNPSHLSAQDIWNDQGEIFTDTKPKPNGSVITIYFAENLIANYRANLEQLRVKNNQLRNSRPVDFDFLPKAELNNRDSETGEVTFSAENDFNGALSGIINSYNNRSKTHRISATHNMIVNGMQQNINLRGTISPTDIEPTMRISSTKIANLRIRLSGITLKKNKKLSAKDFKNLNLDSSSTNKIELTPKKKQDLYLEFFNLILNELF